MSKGLCIILSLILSFLLIAGTGCQDSGRFAVAGKAGTLGLGGEFTVGLATDINARVGYNMLDYDFDEEEIDDVEYDLGVELSSISALLDWHVFDNSFHLTGGFISMDNEIDLDASPTENVEIGDTTYTPSDIGTITGSAEIDGMSPYIGIGWGNPIQSNRRWGFTLDLGVAFTDSPDVSLSSTGIVSPADLEKERQEIEDELDSFKIYPVITLGLFYRF
ncbi:MAG: hypothetical protein JW787_14105 [Sedimentisphaerales bacterium]|nr:hypothetical protein [Sedimentisphaerales bacterium]